MKYGLVVYNKTANIGDDIQSYAAIKFLPKIDYYIEREELDSFVPTDEEQVAVIMNGWFLYNQLNWPPSPYIFPKLISMHFDNFYTMLFDRRLKDNYVLEYAGAQFLLQNGPVGCRDINTLNMVKEKGIDAYFSGCLTLCIDKFHDIDKGDYICLVDIPQELCKTIRRLTDRPIKDMTHFINLETLTYEQRFKKVEEFLRIYQGAHCVITRRLHCSLPCLALGTPVALIYEDWMQERCGSYLQHVVHFTEEAFLAGDVEYDFEHLPDNDTTWISLKEQLELECGKFVSGVNDISPLLPKTKAIVQGLNLKGDALKKILFNEHNSLKILREERNVLFQEHDILRAERDALSQERDALRAEHDELFQERDTLRAERDALSQGRDALRAEHDALSQERDTLCAERDTLFQERDTLRAERDALSQERKELQVLNIDLRDSVIVLEEQNSNVIKQFNEKLECSQLKFEILKEQTQSIKWLLKRILMNIMTTSKN